MAGSGDDESTAGASVAAVDLGAAPAEDALVLEVARSRIANALFATDERVRIGRYQLLTRAGAGGMGVVWSAWDPELDRRVAIKLMHTRSAAAREHMLREGQVLAKLSHPNIVPIYDVGSVDDQVYLVMEWIAGETLRTYVRAGRTTREIVAIYRAAGAGVAAAHHAGIVHRDVKPDNVMRGQDGRVRLVDFGLARPDAGADRIAGTPKYMAPEQARGEPVTPAADQYAFGVALGESLATVGAPPAWLAAIVARATAAEPAARFADMDALLAALAHDPARTWRRRAVAAGVVLAAGAAFAIGTQRAEPALDVCTGAPGELAQVWTPARRAALAAHVATLGPYGASQAPLLGARLDEYGARWTAARRGACLAQQGGDVTPALYERGLACLQRARAALGAVTGTLAHASIAQLPEAIIAARDLPDATSCLADATTDPVAPPRAGVAAAVSQVGAQATAARYLAIAADPKAAAAARAAVAAATALAYPPLVARAQLALGAALESESQPTAVAAYGAAADAALLGGDDAMFVEAFARRLFAAAKWGDAVGAELAAALPFVSTVAARTGEAGRFARPLLYNNAGTARMGAGDRDGAIAWFRRARAEADLSNVEHATILGNLAMLVADRRERDALFAEERAHVEAALGHDHPRTLLVRTRAALFVEAPAPARAQLREICDAYAQQHPHLPAVGHCHFELAWLAAEQGDAREAMRAYAVVAASAQTATMADLARAELARLGGDPAGAIAIAAPVARAVGQEPQWWKRLLAIDAWLVVAGAETARGDRAAAVTALEAARAILLAVQPNTSATSIQRRRARVDALLALATRDRALAAAAIAWYRAAGGYDAAIQALSW